MQVLFIGVGLIGILGGLITFQPQWVIAGALLLLIAQLEEVINKLKSVRK